MDHTIPAAAERGNTSHSGPPGPAQTDPDAAGPSLLRRTVRLTAQIVSALVVGPDGETHQERLMIPVGTIDDIIRVAYEQADMVLLALDRHAGPTLDTEADIGAIITPIH